MLEDFEKRAAPAADDDDGRYHGAQRRGGQTRAAEAGFDVRLAIRELEDAQALYELAVAGATGQLDRADAMREALSMVRTALDKAQLGCRFLESVIKRPAK